MKKISIRVANQDILVGISFRIMTIGFSSNLDVLVLYKKN